MKLLFFFHDSSIHSGANRSALVLLKILKDNYGVDAYVILPKRGDVEEYLSKNSFQYIVVHNYGMVYNSDEGFCKKYLKKLIKMTFNSVALLKLFFIIDRSNIDLVHINSSYEYIGAVWARLRKVPYIWHLRELVDEDHGREFYDIKKATDLYNDASSCIAISDAVYKKFSKMINASRLVRIYNGIEINRFYKSEKKIFESNIIKMVIVGFVSVSKGQYELIEALKLVQQNGNNNWVLKIIGEEKDGIARKKVKELQLEDKIFFEEFDSNIEEAYAQYDIAFMCSRAEGFGRVTVEAMLEGCLVIGANTGATPEIIDDGTTGFLYQKGDSWDLAQKIVYVLDNIEQAKNVANCGRKYAYDHFSADKNAKEIYEVYESVLHTE